MVNNNGDCVMLLEKVVISKKKVVTCKPTGDKHELIHVAIVLQTLFSFFTLPADKKFGKHWTRAQCLQR